MAQVTIESASPVREGPPEKQYFLRVLLVALIPAFLVYPIAAQTILKSGETVTFTEAITAPPGCIPRCNILTSTQFQIVIPDSVNWLELRIEFDTSDSAVGATPFVRFGQPVGIEDGRIISNYSSTYVFISRGAPRDALRTGTYYVAFSISGSSGTKTTKGRITAMFGAAPRIKDDGIVNAASFQSRAIAPNTIISILGAKLGPQQPLGAKLTADQAFLTTESGGTRVLFDGIAAPLLYVSDTQINAIVPSFVQSRSQVRVQVESNGTLSNPVDSGVTQFSPGIFAQGFQAAALNQDYSVNQINHPAQKLSTIMLFGTGLGLTTPSATDGMITPLNSLFRTATPVRAIFRWFLPTTGNVEVEGEVTYAGLAPGWPNGVYQINVKIPLGALAIDINWVQLRIGSESSPNTNGYIWVTYSSEGK